MRIVPTRAFSQGLSMADWRCFDWITWLCNKPVQSIGHYCIQLASYIQANSTCNNCACLWQISKAMVVLLATTFYVESTIRRSKSFRNVTSTFVVRVVGIWGSLRFGDVKLGEETGFLRVQISESVVVVVVSAYDLSLVGQILATSNQLGLQR